MNEKVRRPIKELITRYTLEPKIRDIYVEGPGHKLFFEWFLKKFNCADVVVFDIDDIEITNDLLDKYALQSQKRGRVIGLAIELERLLEESHQYVVCIADSDFDFLIGRNHHSFYLTYTDYTSLAMYCFTEDILEKALMLGIRHVPCQPVMLLNNLAEVLEEVFCIRTANEKLRWNLTWIDFLRCCTIKDNMVSIDCCDLIDRYLSSNDRMGSKGIFVEVYEQIKRVEVEDCRQRIRGHDFLELMAWYFARQVKVGRTKYSDPEVIRSIIFPAIDVKLLAEESMFSKLLEKYEHSSQ